MIPLSIKTQREWTHPEGYKFLVQWTNLLLLRELVKIFLAGLPPKKFRLESQMEDASRSMISTLEEGWKRPSTKEYLDFLGFTQASLEEVKGDVYRSLQDGFLKSIPGSSLMDLGIDLKEFKEMFNPHVIKEVRGKIIEEFRGKNASGDGNVRQNDNGHENTSSSICPLNSSKHPLRDPIPGDYLPLKSLRFDQLTYEVFMELINKTDFLIRKLVLSLQESGERKLEIKKNVREWEFQQGNKWLESYMEKQGYRKLEDGRWVKNE